jgi:histidinol-phosphate/aromatic aminotransferase/cobyric acid decarboxylase-like protein
VPRTFGPGHPLASHLRITVRDAAQDDRLIAAAHELELVEAVAAAQDPESEAEVPA